MSCERTRYKDRPAISVSTGDLTALLLPEDGAKLVSLRRSADGRELLVTKPGAAYGVLTPQGSYVDSECSGFDDMFPTVDPDRPVEHLPPYPDHGECCRLPYRAALREDGVTFTARSQRFPISYQKTVQAHQTGALTLTYTLENRGAEPFPFLWAGHIMLAGQEVEKLLTPFPAGAPTEMMFADPAPEQGVLLPADRLTGHRPGEGTAYKFYYLDPVPKGEFGLRYRDGSTLRFTYDPHKLPYLGIWLNNGRFQNGYSITPEPCTVPFDAPGRAASRGYRSVIPAGQAFSFTIQIQLSGGILCVQ